MPVAVAPVSHKATYFLCSGSFLFSVIVGSNALLTKISFRNSNTRLLLRTVNARKSLWRSFEDNVMIKR